MQPLKKPRALNLIFESPQERRCARPAAADLFGVVGTTWVTMVTVLDSTVVSTDVDTIV